MTSTHRPPGIRRLVSTLVAAVLAVGGVAIVATPAHADTEAVQTTITATADPEAPSTVLLHAEMTGPYIDAGGAIPAGTWSILVADESGATLFSQDVAQASGGSTTADAVWTDVPAGVQASVIVMYLPSESAEQFEFAGYSVGFASEGTSPAAPELSQSEPAPTAVEGVSGAFPLWNGLLAAGAALLVAAAVILLLLRRKKSSAVEPSSGP